MTALLALVLSLAAGAQQPGPEGCMGPPPGGPSPGGPSFAARSSDGGLAERYDSGGYDALLIAQGMSAAGVKALHGPARSGDTFRTRSAAADAAVRQAAAATPLDVGTLGSALRARDAVVIEQRQQRTRRLLRALAVLSPADRAVLVSLVGTGDAAASGFGPGGGGPPPGGPGGPPPGGPPPGCAPSPGGGR